MELKNFRDFLMEEKDKESKQDIDFEKAKEDGKEIAQKIFGDEYDEKKAMAVINGLIQKVKDGKFPDVKDNEDLNQVFQNAFDGND